MKEICTLLLKLYIICSRMQRVNLHARPSNIQVGCTTCCYHVCAPDHAKGVQQTWITALGPAIVMGNPSQRCDVCFTDSGNGDYHQVISQTLRQLLPGSVNHKVLNTNKAKRSVYKIG